MNWITWVFWIGIYGIIVKTGLWIYKKLTKNKAISKDSFDLKAHNELNGEHFPIVVENNYTLQAELTSKILFLLFFIFLISISLSPETDSLKELSRRMALWTAIFGFGFVLLTRNKILLVLIKNKLYIREDSYQMTYDYVTEKGELKTDVILKDQIQSAKWSYFPYSVKGTEIWITENKSDIWLYIAIPLSFATTILYFFIFLVLRKLRLQKYVLYRTEVGIVAIPLNSYRHLLPIKYEWRTLMNTYITTGGHYGN